MEFQMDTFKEKLAEVCVDIKYSKEEFIEILNWIKNNFGTTYSEEADLYFGPTQTAANIQKSFVKYVEQINERAGHISGEEYTDYDPNELKYMYVASLCVHAYDQIIKKEINRVFQNY